MTTVDLAAAAAQIREQGPQQAFRELVEGSWFLAFPPTPLLDRTLERIRDRLAEGARQAGAAVTLTPHDPLVVGRRSLVVPDLTVRDEGGQVVLVVELRSESTDRYALGIKRLVYQTARVPEYWFAEPRTGRVQVLHREPDSFDYAWPPRSHAGGDVLVPRALPGILVAVADLFEPGAMLAGTVPTPL